jgi:hypothetical protein
VPAGNLSPANRLIEIHVIWPAWSADRGPLDAATIARYFGPAQTLSTKPIGVTNDVMCGNGMNLVAETPSHPLGLLNTAIASAGLASTSQAPVTSPVACSRDPVALPRDKPLSLRWSEKRRPLDRDRLKQAKPAAGAYFARTYFPSFTVRRMRERSSRP